MAETHKLKAIYRYWKAVKEGRKMFEVRKNDRSFQTGDLLELVAILDDGKSYATEHGHACIFPDDPATLKLQISYILQGGQFGILPGHCVLGLTPTSEGGE